VILVSALIALGHVTVVFDTVGYRTLSLALVRQRGLLVSTSLVST
jgi:hypothetical protein